MRPLLCKDSLAALDISVVFVNWNPVWRTLFKAVSALVNKDKMEEDIKMEDEQISAVYFCEEDVFKRAWESWRLNGLKAYEVGAKGLQESVY